MKSWKRNAIVAGVLVVICAGVYLNWLKDETTQELTEALDADKLLDDGTLVLNGEDVTQEVIALAGGDEYFAQMRLSRQTARDEAVTLLQETISYAEGGDVTTTSAALEGIVADALAESQIESMVIAKGYTDCVAYISEDGISLAVAEPENGLSQTDISLLADIVVTQTDLSLSDIRIFGVE